MLGKPSYYYGESFLNCYIGDKKHPEYTDCIWMLFKFNGARDFIYFERELQKSDNYIFDYDPANGLILFAFSIPDEYVDDYLLFKDGKYSKFSIGLKNKILGGISYGKNYDILTKNANYKKELEMKLGQ